MKLYQQVLVRQQRGAVLLVGLIMLLLLTIIGMASIRGSDLQERMAGNMRDRNIAFQSAETALRRGEETVSGFAGLSLPAINTAGYYEDLNKTTDNSLPDRPAAWTSAVWAASGKQIADTTLTGVSEKPRFVVEKVPVTIPSKNVGSGVDVVSDQGSVGEFFRVTARGLGGTADAEIILQSTFVR